MNWQSKVRLSEGESLRLDGKHDKGNLGQEEIERYSIIDREGQVTGAVQITDHMSIKAPFRRSHHLVQRDSQGAVVLDERWAG